MSGTPRHSAIVAISGLATVAAYLAGAAISGHVSPFARQPLLDDGGPPAPYNWVSPPPALAPTNKTPQSGSYTLDVAGASQPGVFQTNDNQAVLILPQGAIPRSTGQTSVQLTLSPLNPSDVSPAPKGEAVAGNVYLIEGVYQPGGKPVANLAGGQAEAALVYPLTTSSRHVMLFSPDGKAWTQLPSSDSIAQHQVLATKVTQLGYFAVGVPGGSGSSPLPPPSSSGGIGGVLTGIIAAVAAIVLLLAVRAEYVRRRTAREEASARKQASRRRR